MKYLKVRPAIKALPVFVRQRWLLVMPVVALFAGAVFGLNVREHDTAQTIALQTKQSAPKQTEEEKSQGEVAGTATASAAAPVVPSSPQQKAQSSTKPSNKDAAATFKPKKPEVKGPLVLSPSSFTFAAGAIMNRVLTVSASDGAPIGMPRREGPANDSVYMVYHTSSTQPIGLTKQSSWVMSFDTRREHTLPGKYTINISASDAANNKYTGSIVVTVLPAPDFDIDVEETETGQPNTRQLTVRYIFDAGYNDRPGAPSIQTDPGLNCSLVSSGGWSYTYQCTSAEPGAYNIVVSAEDSFIAQEVTGTIVF